MNNIKKILKELNKEQRKAAETFEGPMLILAGAGSGKTKTLTVRTANMILNNIDGNSILVLTFTNKAAKEMKERGLKIIESLDIQSSIPDFTTFHSWCLKFIKNHISFSEELSSNFTISDENSNLSILNDLIHDIYGGKEKTPIRNNHLSSIFSILQNNLISFKDESTTCDEIFNLIGLYNKRKLSPKFLIDNFVNPNSFKDIKLLSRIYVEYKNVLRKNNMVDFDDLINLTINILENNKEIQKNLQNQYNYIMVDEFQDTNFAQIKLLDLITNKKNNICVVGDDSQSIYGWRGADISYILTFQEKFKNTTVINLTKNYRSTENIVSRANKLLESAEEKHSLKESLKAFRKDDGKILCSQFYNEYDEGRFIANEINKALYKGVKPEEIAILYRSNYIVNSLEKELIKAHVPYQIFKGRTILQRKASIEFMSLIQFIVNPKNMISLEMFLTSTAKIISDKKMLEINEYLNNNKISLFKYLNNIEEIEKSEIKFTKKILSDIEEFLSFIAGVNSLRETGNMNDIAKFIIQNGFLFKEYERIQETSKSENTVGLSKSALSNLHLLISLLKDYSTLEEFLEDITLSSETENNEAGKINLMTIHASKGLEFEYVFLVRFNNGIFPSKRSMVEPALLEEERRLAYVAITRAKIFLSISHIEKDFNGMLSPSMFLRESGIIKLNKRINMYNY